MATDQEEKESRGERVQAIRAALGMTQDQFAAMLRDKGLWPKCASGTVAQWEKGSISPRAARVLASVDPNGQTAGSIMAGDGDSARIPQPKPDKEKIKAMRDLEVILEQGDGEWIDHIKRQLRLFAKLSGGNRKR